MTKKEKIEDKYIVNNASIEEWNMHAKNKEIIDGDVPGVGKCEHMVVYDYSDKVEYEKVYLVHLGEKYFFLTDEGTK